MKVLIVVATAAEAAALGRMEAHVQISGVGPVAAALATQKALLEGRFDLVVSAGIAGAYPGSALQPGDLAVSSRIVHADLGAWDGDTWLTLDELKLPVTPHADHFGSFDVWEGAGELAARSGGALGPMLTLSSVTGTQARADVLASLHPGALTEGMEGAGVAHAAFLAGVPSLEVRGVSNAVGPRDRSSWQIPAALAATRHGLQNLLTLIGSA